MISALFFTETAAARRMNQPVLDRSFGNLGADRIRQAQVRSFLQHSGQ